MSVEGLRGRDKGLGLECVYLGLRGFISLPGKLPIDQLLLLSLWLIAKTGISALYFRISVPV